MEGSDAVQSDDIVQSELELETLFSIYVRELVVNRNENGNTAISIQLHPATADKLEEQFVRMTLVFSLSKEYPDVTPEICIQNTRGLSDEKIDEIILHLEEEAEERRGSLMLFELIELAKEHLTAGNKPNEECAICLYGFLDGDSFMKTECYHYFHCHCLSRYVESRLSSEDEKEKVNDSKLVKEDENSSQKVLCPICRLEISFPEFGQSFPEPLAVLEASFAIDVQSCNELKKFEELYQKQLAQGGIIDLKAEDEKFLLEISSISDDIPTPVKSPEQNHSSESEINKQKGSSTSDGKGRNSSYSKTSPRKFRYLKSRPKQNETNIDACQSKNSCAEDAEILFQQNLKSGDKKSTPPYHRPCSDSPLTRKSKCDLSYKLEQEAATNIEDDKDLLSDKRESSPGLGEDQESVPSTNAAAVKNNYSASRTESNRNNNYNKYNSRRTYDKPYINNFQARQNNSNMGRENNYRKYNTSRGSYNSSRGSGHGNSYNHGPDDPRGRDERSDPSFRAYQNNNPLNRTYNKKERSGPFPNEKFQGRSDNYGTGRSDNYGTGRSGNYGNGRSDNYGNGRSDNYGNVRNDNYGPARSDNYGTPRSDGQYRNNFRERNNYNGNSSSNYARGFQNEKQKYFNPNSPKTQNQYQPFKRVPNRGYNQNNYYANNEPRRHYNGESKNIGHEADYPSKFNNENPRNFSHSNRYNRKPPNEHSEHPNRRDSKFDNFNKDDNIQSNSKVEELNKREYQKVGHVSSSHKKFIGSDKHDDDNVGFETSLTDLPQSVEKEMSPCPSQGGLTEKYNVKAAVIPEEYQNCPLISSSISSNAVPSLPPGFANPSKKVIYGLPSFHVSPPPGFQLS